MGWVTVGEWAGSRPATAVGGPLMKVRLKERVVLRNCASRNEEENRKNHSHFRQGAGVTKNVFFSDFVFEKASARDREFVKMVGGLKNPVSLGSEKSKNTM